MCTHIQYMGMGCRGWEEETQLSFDGAKVYLSLVILSCSANRIGIVHLLCDHSVKLADSQLVFVGELSQYHYVSTHLY